MNPKNKTDRLIEEEMKIHHRLKWMADKPDGDLFAREEGYDNITVNKKGREIQLFLFKNAQKELQSRIDITDPLSLIAPYTQAMMLGLLWNSNPANVYVVGLGGGRVPLVMHHYYPETYIDCSEINPDIIEIAEKCFAFHPDEYVNIILHEGRKYLEDNIADKLYDLIMVDAFSGVGFGAISLATLEFWNLCKKHLATGGTIVLNLLNQDPLLDEKLSTIAAAFSTVYVCRHQGCLVVFANDYKKTDINELLNRAKLLQKEHAFVFPFMYAAAELQLYAENNLILNRSGKNPRIITDDFPASVLPINETILANINPNDYCPCGSGKKFKLCHGV